VNITILILWATSKAFPARILHSLTGLFAWSTCHSRLAFPFLHSSHTYVNQPMSKHPPPQVRSQLVRALALTAKSVSHPFVAPALLPRLGAPIMFVDAAAGEGFSWCSAFIPNVGRR